MANFHCTAQMISRQGGKSCVAALAYRSATELIDQRTGETWDYTKKANVGHVEILLPDNAPSWVSEIARECHTDRQPALQKFSDIIEASEKRKDSQVYREVEFSLPNELTKEQNIEWANAFVQDVLVERGMVAIVNFHFDVDPKTGMEKPHCHALLSTRHLTENGFGLKNRDWNRKDLIEEARDQCAQYQNTALKEHGHDVRVTHLSYVDREVDIDPQPKLGANVREMARNGVETDKQKVFDLVRLKNQFKIVKNPEIVFDIVTSNHATFTRKDIAKILNRYIDDTGQFQFLLDRLMNSKELVPLQPKPEEEAGKGVLKEPGKEGGKEQGKEERQEPEKGQEPVYTTRKMVRAELDLIKTAEALATRKTHPVSARITNKVVARYNRKFKKDGGLSTDQETAIRHMLSGEQISCVVGFAGAGKTTCLEAVHEAWEEAGYSVLGLAPTGKAAQSIAACGVRSMTVHRFLRSQEQGREKISRKTIVVLDEAGMLDSRRFSELQAIVAKAGAKIVPMGDGNQTQAVEAGPPFRLITDRITPAVLKAVVRQQIGWQREASRFFGTLQPRKALKLYQENGCFYCIQEKKPDLTDEDKTIDNYCLARQISGRIWKEMLEDTRAGDIRTKNEKEGTDNKGSVNQRVDKRSTFDRGSTVDFEAISQHQDYATHTHWKNMRHYFVQSIIHDFDIHKAGLEARGVDVKAFGKLVAAYKATESDTGVPDTGAEENREIIFEWIENALRKMSYENIVDTRVNARQALVEAWAIDRKASPNQSHLMLAFTKEDAHKLNEAARVLMREQGAIKGADFTYTTQTIEEDDFGVEYREYHERTFAKGDRILFTRNDKGLGVSNGTLGTILSLRQGKIQVALDGDGNNTVSFSPRLHPFFDNGWGTTIRKAQSVTVDHVKFLGSWQDYRNLAYVALTRHRHSLKLFYSDLDFWRPEKLSDRLSRIQEKLSGFDYLDAEKLQELLKEDTQILWHNWHLKKIEDGIQQGKDFWAAIKVTAQDVFETIIPPKQREHNEQTHLGQTRLEQARLGEEAFQSLEDSEEMRSRKIFKDTETGVDDHSSVHNQPPADGRPHGEGSSSQESTPQSPPDASPGVNQKGGEASSKQGPSSQVPSMPVVDFDRLKNQSKIMKNPEIILEIVTAKHSTFTKKDIARVLNEHIDDPTLFQVLYDRLSNSKELINLEKPVDREDVFTTQKMLRIEKNLVTQAKALAVKNTHPVAPHIIERVIARFHKKYEEHGGLSADQERAIRHMLSGEQISCVVGFAGAGKTTCLEAVSEAWEEAGYTVLGLAPTGKAAQSIEACGVRSMTVHKFLKEHKKGKISLSSKTVVVIDEAGMVDSRRFNQLQTLVAEAGAKIVPMGDNNQLQSIEAGPAYRLVCNAVKPVVLETIVRQRIPWQREATRLFGMAQPRQALALYQKEGAFETIQETMPIFRNPNCYIEDFCLARQVSGRIWKEIGEDYKAAFGTAIDFEEEGIFEVLSKHQDFDLYTEWKDRRKGAVENIIHTFDQQRPKLDKLGVDIDKLGSLVSNYLATPPEAGGAIFEEIEKILRKMSYGHIVDTRADTKQALVAAWVADLEAAPEHSHLMLAFTNRDTSILNESARLLMREKGKIIGSDYQFETKYIEEDDFGNVTVIRETRQFAQGDRILFTLNHEKLGVRNGNLGTILSLDEETITVALDGKEKDGKEKQELAFSPHEYPFIDNGWATNIHKAQSATAGDVKLLGSFEQYRNMVYVGMTRHWNSLKVYVSDLDFWREEKIFDRLSRVQEKLSGFDYLDEAAILEKLKPEKPASVQEGIQESLSEEGKGEVPEEGKARYGFWGSFKKGISSFFESGKAASEDPELAFDSDLNPNPIPKDPIFNKPAQSDQKIDFLNEDYLDLEDTEEKRSSDIFKDPFDARGKEAFAGEGGEEADETGGDAARQKGQARSASRSQKKQEGNQDGKQEVAPKPPLSTTQNKQNAMHVERKIQEASGQQEGVTGKSSSQPSPDPAPGSSSPPLSNDEFKKKLKAVKEKIKSDYETKIVTREKLLSFEEVDKQLKERIYELATSIFGEPNRGSRNSAYLRFGESGKFSVGVRGKHHGVYTNFTTNVKGGPLKLIEDQIGYSSSKEALAWAREWLGGRAIVAEHQAVRKAGKEQEEDPKLKWKPIIPIPNGVKGPDLTNKYLKYMVEDGWYETARYAYRDAQGNLKGYVVRVEKEREDGKKNDKKTRPLAWCKNEKSGITCWRSQAFDEENKTPYGIEKLAQDTSKPILVVEGEKTADAAQKRLPGYHVLSWIGGSGSVGLTNWELLIGKTVVMWPDNDEPGRKAAQGFQKAISQLEAEKNLEIKVGIVPLPKDLVEEWDLGDPLPKGWTEDIVVQMIEGATPVREEMSAKEEAPPPDEGANILGVGSKAEDGVSPPSPVPPFSSSSDAPLEHGSSEATPSEKALPVKSPQKRNSLDHKQEKFEKGRLPFHQEWCAQLGFFVQHRRFPSKGKEIAAAWWQGERLTAIEGRLCREALERNEEPDEEQLTLGARAELAKNQKAPSHIMSLGKASELDKDQLKQFEQHVLIHRDKTGQLPNPSDLDALCQAIKVRSQVMELEGTHNRVNNQGAMVTKTSDATPDEKASEKTPGPDLYRILIEQQAVLARIKGDGLNNLAKSEGVIVELQGYELVQFYDIRDSCSERLDRLDAKIESIKELSQDMKALDRSRQNQRGIEM